MKLWILDWPKVLDNIYNLLEYLEYYGNVQCSIVGLWSTNNDVIFVHTFMLVLHNFTKHQQKFSLKA